MAGTPSAASPTTGDTIAPLRNAGGCRDTRRTRLTPPLRVPHAKALFVWNHEHLTECLSADDNLFAAMCHDELLHHSKILW